VSTEHNSRTSAGPNRRNLTTLTAGVRNLQDGRSGRTGRSANHRVDGARLTHRSLPTCTTPFLLNHLSVESRPNYRPGAKVRPCVDEPAGRAQQTPGPPSSTPATSAKAPPPGNTGGTPTICRRSHRCTAFDHKLLTTSPISSLPSHRTPELTPPGLCHAAAISTYQHGGTAPSTVRGRHRCARPCARERRAIGSRPQPRVPGRSRASVRRPVHRSARSALRLKPIRSSPGSRHSDVRSGRLRARG